MFKSLETWFSSNYLIITKSKWIGQGEINQFSSLFFRVLISRAHSHRYRGIKSEIKHQPTRTRGSVTSPCRGYSNIAKCYFSGFRKLDDTNKTECVLLEKFKSTASRPIPEPILLPSECNPTRLKAQVLWSFDPSVWREKKPEAKDKYEMSIENS